MTIEAQLPDGRTLQFPDGTDPAIIQGKVKELIAAAPVIETQQPLTPEQETAQFKEMGFLEQMGSLMPSMSRQSEIAREQIAKPAGVIASGAIAEPIAGATGLAVAPFVGAEQAEKTMKATREAITQPFMPETQEAQETLKGIGETITPVIEPIEKGVQAIGDFTFELTGSPALAAAAKTAPAAALEILGLKGLQSIKRGTRLLDDAGRPTQRLRKALDKRGLDYDSLTPEAKAAIPPIADPNMIPGANLPAGASEKALVAQIKAGARDDSLAGLRVVGNRVEVDQVGKEALKQGFRPGVVQSIKTANPATKAKMREMTRMMRQIKKSERLGLEFRPSDVVGDSVTSRIQFIRDKADVARKELNTIADTKLRGKQIDIAPVTNRLQSSLDDLDVSLVDGPGGIPKPEFKGSLISKDKTSQRVISDVIDLLGEGGRPDALRAHKLKRQLDIMIDFNKKSAEGLTDAGRNVLKGIRKELNNSIRAVDPDYARVNDTLSQSLNSLNSLDDAIGTIDMFGKGANKALGTRMRALLSNQQGRVRIENAVDDIENTVTNLGGKFDDNIKDLVMFSDTLDDRFGTVAKTSLAGQEAQAIRQAAREGVAGTVRERAVEAVGRGAEKLRGVNEFNAFEAMNKLLKRGSK